MMASPPPGVEEEEGKGIVHPSTVNKEGEGNSSDSTSTQEKKNNTNKTVKDTSESASGVSTLETTGDKKELLPNGIPKIVYDVPPPSSVPMTSASSSTSSVKLDAWDSHLDLEIDKATALRASCMHTGGFQYLWKGVRATHGVKGRGKYYFETKVGPRPAAVIMPDTPANTQHVCRIGVSQPLTSLHLGDSAESWGFGGTGKKSTERRFLDYGTSFGDGDVVGVMIDLDNLTLSYTKNGQFLGTAFELHARVRETGLFPHIYVKNFDFQVNFKKNTKWFLPPGDDFRFIGDLSEQELMANPVEHPKDVSECEFLMMCGLPACGKTYWAEKHMEKHAKKSYVLLGTNAVIDQMKVMGLKRQANYATRWEELMSTATEVFNSLVNHAGAMKIPRNIIIDQTNAAFALPSLDDGFTVIDYVEMPEAESQREIRRINEEGRAFKANNQGVTSRQPKPHIETRAAYAEEAGGYPAKRHKGDSAYGASSWGQEGYYCGGYASTHQQGSCGSRREGQGAGWQSQGNNSSSNNSGGGKYPPYYGGSSGGYGYEGRQSSGGRQDYRSSLQYQGFGGEQREVYSSGYSTMQQQQGSHSNYGYGCAYGEARGDSSYRGVTYDSRYKQAGNVEQRGLWQNAYAGAGGGGGWQQGHAPHDTDRRGGAGGGASYYAGNYYSSQGRY